MRSGRPRDRPRPPQALGAARGAAQDVRRLARRLARLERPQGGAQLRVRGEGLPDGGDEAPRAEDAVRRLLELPPLPRRRGLQGRHRLPERPRLGPAQGQVPGLRQQLHRRRPDVRAGGGVRDRRLEAERVRGPRRAAARRTARARARVPREPAADRARPRDARVHADLRRQGAERRLHAMDLAAARGDGRRGGGDVRPHVGAAVLPAPPRDEDGAGELRQVPPPRAAAAGRLLHATPAGGRRRAAWRRTTPWRSCSRATSPRR